MNSHYVAPRIPNTHSFPLTSLLLFLILSLTLIRGYVFIDLRGSEQERERERERHRQVASHTHPSRGWSLQPRYVSWPGTKHATFWCTGWHSNQLSHAARAFSSFFFCSQSRSIQSVRLTARLSSIFHLDELSQSTALKSIYTQLLPFLQRRRVSQTPALCPKQPAPHHHNLNVW